MKILPIFTALDSKELSLKEITEVSNRYASVVGIKTTKRFASKPAAIKKCLVNQLAYNEWRKKNQVPKSTLSNNKAGKFGLDTVFELGDVRTKPDTAMSIFTDSLMPGKLTASHLLKDSLIHYKPKRSNAIIDYGLPVVISAEQFVPVTLSSRNKQCFML